MKEQIEHILCAKVEHEHRWATGRITYDFSGGILYENLQLLLVSIMHGMPCTISFDSYQSTFVRDGILSTPRTIIVNGQQILSEGISVSYIDQEVAEKSRRQDKYV